MKSEIKGGPGFAYIELQLEPGETIVAESDAMASMSAQLDMDAKLNGGLFSAIGRKFFGKESFFVNHFKNNGTNPMQLILVQPTPGAIRKVDLENSSIYFQPGAFIARTEGVKMTAQWAGFRSWFSGEGLFRLKVSGSGSVWYGAYGGFIDKEINGEYIVDTSHLVAYDPGIKLRVQLAGGIFSSFFGGEGFVTRLEGKGKVTIQTRSVSGLASWLNPKFWN